MFPRGGSENAEPRRDGEAQEERTSLEGAPAAFAEQRRSLIAQVEQAEAARREAFDRRASAETLLAEADKAARAALEAFGEARTEAARAEERLEAAGRRTADIAHEIREILETEPHEVAAMAEIRHGDTLPDVAEIEEKLDKLRRDRERLGAVNLRAEEELKEVEAQHTNLVTERDDLTEAIKRLRQGIQSLNKEARERLLSSFEVVNGHFQRLFTSLFGGGTATNNYTINGLASSTPTYFTADLSLAYTIPSMGKDWLRNTTITVGANNLFNKAAPYVPGDGSFVAENNTVKNAYDIIGRFMFVELKKGF